MTRALKGDAVDLLPAVFGGSEGRGVRQRRHIASPDRRAPSSTRAPLVIQSPDWSPIFLPLAVVAISFPSLKRLSLSMGSRNRQDEAVTHLRIDSLFEGSCPILPSPSHLVSQLAAATVPRYPRFRDQPGLLLPYLRNLIAVFPAARTVS